MFYNQEKMQRIKDRLCRDLPIEFVLRATDINRRIMLEWLAVAELDFEAFIAAWLTRMKLEKEQSAARRQAQMEEQNV